MPISVTELLGDVGESDIDVGIGKVHVWYRPSAYTPDLEEAFHKKIDEQHYSASVVQLLAGYEKPAAEVGADNLRVPGLLIRWDMLRGDGSGDTIPCTVEELGILPTTFLRKVMDQVLKDMRPNAESDVNSEDI